MSGVSFGLTFLMLKIARVFRGECVCFGLEVNV